MVLESRSPTSAIFRIGRHPDPWEPPDWSRAHTDGTFGNRFDDPLGYYRVLYASSQRIACFMETLARFRPDLSLLAELNELDGENDFAPIGTLSLDWLTERRMGTATANGEYADIYASGWSSHLRRTLAAKALSMGLTDIDVATLQAGVPRQLTQQASLEVYEHKLNGIFYRSRYGHSLENWAIFEPFPLTDKTSSFITPDDADLAYALECHGIVLT